MDTDRLVDVDGCRDRVLYSAGADGNIHAWDMVSLLHPDLDFPLWFDGMGSKASLLVYLLRLHVSLSKPLVPTCASV